MNHVLVIDVMIIANVMDYVLAVNGNGVKELQDKILLLHNENKME
jgi:hypothetical protein